MKKSVLTVLVAVFGFSVMQAQEEGVRFGAKLGLNVSNIRMDNGSQEGGEKELNGRTSFHLGVVVEIPLLNKLAFQPELIYSAQGAKSEYSSSFSSGLFDESSKTESILKYNYLNIPLMAKYYVTQGVSLETGPQIGFLLSAKSMTESVNTIGEGSVTVSEDKDIDNKNGVDFGWSFGAGYQLDMGLFFQARYNLGLSDVYDGSRGDAKAKNRVVSLSMGYKF